MLFTVDQAVRCPVFFLLLIPQGCVCLPANLLPAFVSSKIILLVLWHFVSHQQNKINKALLSSNSPLYFHSPSCLDGNLSLLSGHCFSAVTSDELFYPLIALVSLILDVLIAVARLRSVFLWEDPPC